MKLYLLFGLYEGENGEDFKYFYGCFSTKEMANDVRKDLEEKSYGTKNEQFEIEEHTLDKPTDLYYFMIDE